MPSGKDLLVNPGPVGKENTDLGGRRMLSGPEFSPLSMCLVVKNLESCSWIPGVVSLDWCINLNAMKSILNSWIFLLLPCCLLLASCEVQPDLEEMKSPAPNMDFQGGGIEVPNYCTGSWPLGPLDFWDPRRSSREDYVCYTTFRETTELALGKGCFSHTTKTISFLFSNYEVERVTLANSSSPLLYPDTVVYSPPPLSTLNLGPAPFTQGTQSFSITFPAHKYNLIYIDFWNGVPSNFDLTNHVVSSGGLCIVSNIPDPYL